MIWEKELTDLGGSRALILPTEVLTFWRLSGKSTEKVKMTFKDGKLIVEPAGKVTTIQSVSRPKLKLHEAICLVLYSIGGGLTAAQIADEIRRGKLYWIWTRGNIGNYPKSSQIRARIRKYPELFRKENGKYYLTDKGLKLAKEVRKRL